MKYLMRPSKKFKFKSEDLKRLTKLNKDKKFVKQQNINISTMNYNSILNLQNQIGNKETIILLKELGNLGLLKDEEIAQEITSFGEIYSGIDLNESMETKKEIKDFKKLSRSNNLKSSEAITSGRFTVNHNSSDKPDINNHELAKYVRSLASMVIYFRGYDGKKDKEREKVEVDEKLIDSKDKIIRGEIDILMKMIGRLPDLNEREDNIQIYMKVLNFLVSSGCNLDELFNNNGNIVEQKAILFKVLREKDVNNLVKESPV